MDRQSLFEKAALGLLAQNRRCVSNGLCLYRDDNGNKCAIGHLIPDNLYSEDMECGSATSLVKDHEEVANHLGVDDDDDILFLDTMQTVIHDDLFDSDFKAGLKKAAAEFAKMYSLKVPNQLRTK